MGGSPNENMTELRSDGVTIDDWAHEGADQVRSRINKIRNQVPACCGHADERARPSVQNGAALSTSRCGCHTHHPQPVAPVDGKRVVTAFTYGKWMGLTPRERFKMIRQMTEQVENDSIWPLADMDILLQQFGLETMELDNWGSRISEFARIVGGATDETLVGIYATVLNVDDEAALSIASVPDDHGLWNEGHVRVFLSHTAKEKEFVSDVSRELAVVGIHDFVAHETMQIERPWQSQIEIALRTAEAFVGLVHPPFNESKWCQQELGWAKGRGLPEFSIRFGANPEGFAASTQWPSQYGRSAKEVAHEIVAWLERTTDFTNRIVDGLMGALEEASDYYSAEAAAKRIVALGDLTESSWDRLSQAFWMNNQVHGGVLPTRVLQPFYREKSRDWPPPKALSESDSGAHPANNPGGTPLPGEPPF